MRFNDYEIVNPVEIKLPKVVTPAISTVYN